MRQNWERMIKNWVPKTKGRTSGQTLWLIELLTELKIHVHICSITLRSQPLRRMRRMMKMTLPLDQKSWRITRTRFLVRTVILQKQFYFCIVHCAPCFHLFSLSLINIHSQSHLHINHLDSLALPLTQHYICHKMMFQGRRRQQKSS